MQANPALNVEIATPEAGADDFAQRASGRVGPHVSTTRVSSPQEADEYSEVTYIPLGNAKRKGVSAVDSAFQAAGHTSRHMLRHMPVAGVIYMNPERHVKLFKNGRNQAVRIPREFELPGEDAVMRKEGERLVIEPVVPQSLLALLAILRPLDEDFDTIEELPLEQVDL